MLKCKSLGHSNRDSDLSSLGGNQDSDLLLNTLCGSEGDLRTLKWEKKLAEPFICDAFSPDR